MPLRKREMRTMSTRETQKKTRLGVFSPIYATSAESDSCNPSGKVCKNSVLPLTTARKNSRMRSSSSFSGSLVASMRSVGYSSAAHSATVTMPTTILYSSIL